MHRPPVTASFPQYRDTRRIKVECPHDTEVISQIKRNEENGTTGARPWATHCAGNGFRVEWSREVLGYGASKTDEIYNHLTRKGFEKSESPLDHLDF